MTALLFYPSASHRMYADPFAFDLDYSSPFAYEAPAVYRRVRPTYQHYRRPRPQVISRPPTMAWSEPSLLDLLLGGNGCDMGRCDARRQSCNPRSVNRGVQRPVVEEKLHKETTSSPSATTVPKEPVGSPAMKPVEHEDHQEASIATVPASQAESRLDFSKWQVDSDGSYKTSMTLRPQSRVLNVMLHRVSNNVVNVEVDVMTSTVETKQLSNTLRLQTQRQHREVVSRRMELPEDAELLRGGVSASVSADGEQLVLRVPRRLLALDQSTTAQASGEAVKAAADSATATEAEAVAEGPADIADHASTTGSLGSEDVTVEDVDGEEEEADGDKDYLFA